MQAAARAFCQNLSALSLNRSNILLMRGDQSRVWSPFGRRQLAGKNKLLPPAEGESGEKERRREVKGLKILLSLLSSFAGLIAAAYLGGACYAYFAYGQTAAQSAAAPRWVNDLYPYVLISDDQEGH